MQTNTLCEVGRIPMRSLEIPKSSWTENPVMGCLEGFWLNAFHIRFRS